MNLINYQFHTKPQHVKSKSKTQQSFPVNFPSSHFRCITGVDVTYHHYIYHIFINRITSIIPLLELIVSFIPLISIFLFNRRDLLISYPFDSVTKFIQETSPSCYSSLIHLFQIHVMLVVIDCAYMYYRISHLFHQCCLFYSLQPFQGLLLDSLLRSILITTANVYFLSVSNFNRPSFHESKNHA